MFEQKAKRQRVCDLLCTQVDLRLEGLHSGHCSEQEK
uniref:Uncharacterized protein n=1 Tax=Lepeophtheirus salmonis TaxID=72036 RepID=A0A0K2UNY4_LEPSM